MGTTTSKPCLPLNWITWWLKSWLKSMEWSSLRYFFLVIGPFLRCRKCLALSWIVLTTARFTANLFSLLHCILIISSCLGFFIDRFEERVCLPLSSQEFICNAVQNKKIVIILKLNVISPALLDGKIGQPIEYNGSGQSYNAAPSGPGSLGTLQQAPMQHQVELKKKTFLRPNVEYASNSFRACHDFGCPKNYQGILLYWFDHSHHSQLMAAGMLVARAMVIQEVREDMEVVVGMVVGEAVTAPPTQGQGTPLQLMVAAAVATRGLWSGMTLMSTLCLFPVLTPIRAGGRSKLGKITIMPSWNPARSCMFLIEFMPSSIIFI